MWSLGDVSDRFAKVRNFEAGDVAGAPKNLTLGWSVESLDECGNSRLARSGGTNESNSFAGVDGEANVTEDGGVGSGGV